MRKEVIEIEVKSEGAVQNTVKVKEAVKDVKKETTLANEATNKLTESLDKMTGGAITGFKDLTGGVGKSIRSFGVLKTAILSTGIGALVLAFGALVTYFTQTDRGAEKLKQVFSAVGAVVNVLKDRISGLGEGIALILSGEFNKGAEILKNSFKGVGKEIANESRLASQLSKDLDTLEDREIALIEVNAKRKASIESLRLTAEDETKTNEQRAEALRKAIDLQNKITNDEIAIAKERARISQAQLDMSESTDEQRRANAETQARVIELEGERDRSLKRVTTRLNAFTKETKENTEELKKQEEIKKKIIQLELDAELLAKEKEEKRLEELKIQKQKEAKILYDYELDIQETEDDRVNKAFENSQKLIAIEKSIADAKLEIQNAQIDNVAAGFALLGQIAGKSRALQAVALIGENAAGIARTVINTTAANAKAVAQFPLTLGQPWVGINTASAGIGIASSIAATAKGLSALKAGGSVGSVGNANAVKSQASAPQVQSTSFNIVGSTGTNQLASAIGGQTQQPIKAYVVSNDVTTAQSLDRNIVAGASLG